jgi:hypothetical protein
MEKTCKNDVANFCQSKKDLSTFNKLFFFFDGTLLINLRNQIITLFQILNFILILQLFLLNLCSH